ncbi:MAG: beta-xylosidase [Verrucomicrobia bacterium]|nr:beta-xylosidase [Verrucomicrobiota bacterium]
MVLTESGLTDQLPAAAPAPADSVAVAIRVDASQPLGSLRPIWRFFGADEPNYATMPHGRQLLADLGALAPANVYFRAHNLLCSGDGTPALKWGSTGVYREDERGNAQYDWTILDAIFDTYLERGVRPYAQIGFMPKDLSIRPEPYQHRWHPEAKYSEIFTGWAYPPKDYTRWAELVFQWVKHCVDRYGRNEVESWYWQTWNEPNIGYWQGTPEEFRILHHHAIVIGESDPEGCAACQGPQLAYRNGTMYSSYTAASFARKHDLADRHGVNFAGALTWAFQFEDQPLFAGFRSLATGGIAKPVLNVFRMFSRMTGQRLTVRSTGAVRLAEILEQGVRGQPDVSALASLGSNQLCVLAWHYHDDDRPGPDAVVALELRGLPPHAQQALVEHYRIDAEHSNAFTCWLRLGAPAAPSPGQYQQLVAAGHLARLEQPVTIPIKDAQIDWPFRLPRQAVSLLVFTWAKAKGEGQGRRPVHAGTTTVTRRARRALKQYAGIVILDRGQEDTRGKQGGQPACNDAGCRANRQGYSG